MQGDRLRANYKRGVSRQAEAQAALEAPQSEEADPGVAEEPAATEDVEVVKAQVVKDLQMHRVD